MKPQPIEKMSLPDLIREAKKYIIQDCPEHIVVHGVDDGRYALNDPDGGQHEGPMTILGLSEFTPDQLELLKCANPSLTLIKIEYETETETEK